MAEVSGLKLLVLRDRRCPSIADSELSKMDNRQSFIKAVLWFAGVSVTDFCVFFFLITPTFWRGFPGGSDGKESACNAEDPGLIPGLGGSPRGGHGHPLQYSCLENPMDRGGLQFMGHKRVRHN